MGTLDKLSYEYTKKHRITTGALVMIFSLGAGAVVMLTKSKSNWLYIDYHEQDAKKTVCSSSRKRIFKGYSTLQKRKRARKSSTSATVERGRAPSGFVSGGFNRESFR